LNYEGVLWQTGKSAALSIELQGALLRLDSRQSFGWARITGF